MQLRAALEGVQQGLNGGQYSSACGFLRDVSKHLTRATTAQKVRPLTRVSLCSVRPAGEISHPHDASQAGLQEAEDAGAFLSSCRELVTEPGEAELSVIARADLRISSLREAAEACRKVQAANKHEQSTPEERENGGWTQPLGKVEEETEAAKEPAKEPSKEPAAGRKTDQNKALRKEPKEREDPEESPSKRKRKSNDDASSRRKSKNEEEEADAPASSRSAKRGSKASASPPSKSRSSSSRRSSRR